MSGSEAPPESTGTPDVLESWKEIALYLRRDVRTVMRWEHSRAMPVHRLPGGPRPAVYALRSELEAWRATAAPRPPGSRRLGWTLAAAAGCAVLGATLWNGLPGSLTAWRSETPRIRSLAVLPFDNLTHDSSQDYFVDGMHEALLTDLARLRAVRVTSRTSVMHYRGARRPAREIARELNVDALVEGSVLRSGNRVRITAQLVYAESDEHLWAANYDRDARDVVALLSEVSRAVAGEIRAAVAPGAPLASSMSPPAAAHPVRPDAYEAYLRARHAFNRLTPGGLEEALALYHKAVELDERFALAWAGLAGTRAAQAFFAHRPAAEVLPEARESARRALALDQNLGEAHGAIGFIALYWDWDYAEAAGALKRAVELSPNSTIVRHQYADYLMVSGRVDASLEQVRIGRSYDPMWMMAHGIVLYHALMARRYQDVIDEGRATLAAFADAQAAHELIGHALWLQGRHQQALVEWRERGAGHEGASVLEAGYRSRGPRAAFRARGEWAAARASVNGLASAFGVASWFAGAGDADSAFEWLERSFARREAQLLHVVADPRFDPIRSDPRFESLLWRIGIGR